MAWSRLIVTGLLISVATMTGCSKNTVKDENALLRKENEELRAQLEDRSNALTSANGQLQDRDSQIAQLRQEGAGGNAASSGGTGFENIPGVSGSVGAGEVTASMESDVLFDSGKATLKATAKKSLDQVASVLKGTYGSNSIRIDGHTDTDPIHKSGFKSNYHLGFERAFAVREYLLSKGVSSGQVYLASHGPDEPKGSKQQSRRVEIVVLLNQT